MSPNFFDTLGGREKRLARDRTDVLTAMLMRWARQYSTIRTARVPSVALLTATVAPRIAPIDAFVSTKLAFWIFGVDDIADERAVPLAELEKRASQWCLIARDGSADQVDETDELATMFLEIRRELSTFPLFESLQGHWILEVRRFVEAMIWEYRWGVGYTTHGPDALPTLDEYLNQGLHSISIPLWAWTIWAAANDHTVCLCLEPINQATEYAGAAVRLYNDLRSFEKEREEGNINSVLITYCAMLDEHPDIPVEDLVPQAKQYILQLADAYGQKCTDLVRQVRTDSGKAEEALSRIVAFHAYFYGRSRHDYNSTSMRDVYNLLGQSRSWSM
jgi:hypothetical protein